MVRFKLWSAAGSAGTSCVFVFAFLCDKVTREGMWTGADPGFWNGVRLILCACKMKACGMRIIFGMSNTFCCEMYCTTSIGGSVNTILAKLKNSIRLSSPWKISKCIGVIGQPPDTHSCTKYGIKTQAKRLALLIELCMDGTYSYTIGEVQSTSVPRINQLSCCMPVLTDHELCLLHNTINFAGYVLILKAEQATEKGLEHAESSPLWHVKAKPRLGTSNDMKVVRPILE